MHIIKARNVHEALPEAVSLMTREGQQQTSRNGDVFVLPQPVTTLYERPYERVLFWPERDANPFFHFYEALWMLGGRNDVASLTRFVKRMDMFSDDGIIFHGAYGHRWRRWFNHDQILEIINNLILDSTDRRQVLQIWDADYDLYIQKDKRDLPCNLVAHFQIRNEALDMTVFCRSNDIVWGTYGANAVHFSMLQEFMASAIGVNVGRYWHVSDNWHAYLDTFDKVKMLGNQRREPPDTGPENPYYWADIQAFPMVNGSADRWLSELTMFLDQEHKAMGYRDRFFRRVALPMMLTHNIYKSAEAGMERYPAALEAADDIYATDWKRACKEWIQRRWDIQKKRRELRTFKDETGLER